MIKSSTTRPHTTQQEHKWGIHVSEAHVGGSRVSTTRYFHCRGGNHDHPNKKYLKYQSCSVISFEWIIVIDLPCPDYQHQIETYYRNCIQSSIVVMRFKITRYCIHHYRNWSWKQIWFWIHKKKPIPGPNGPAMGCLMWGFGENWSRSHQRSHTRVAEPSRYKMGYYRSRHRRCMRESYSLNQSVFNTT